MNVRARCSYNGSSLAVVMFMVSALAAVSCVTGPKYTTPTTPVPAAYKEADSSNTTSEWQPAQPGDTSARGSWWEEFQEPELNGLESRLNISNQTIAAAAADVQAARAMIRGA